MTQLKNFAYGLPSVPRETMPSMYQILSWNDENTEKNVKHSHPQVIQTSNNTNEPVKQQKNGQQIKGNIIQDISEVKSQHSKCEGKRISKSCTKHYQLYEYKQIRGKAQSQSHVTTSNKKASASQVIKPPPKKLDPKNEDDQQEIDGRKKRIKTFQLVTRELPNSAFTTYYGKPAFQAYGRGGSNPSLLSHNVMPHKGDNHPKSVQSYYSALIKGKKTSSSSNVNHVPRKPIQEKRQQIPKNHEEIVHIPMQKPDLINNVRFTAADPRQKKQEPIPSNKVTLLKQKVAKKSVRKEKKAKGNSKQKAKIEFDDGLKYMNNREDLLKIMENKKLTASRLAYKVTQCYPCEWQNEQKLKQSTRLWQNTKMAGVPSKKCDKVSDLLKINKESPL